jgi:hypothetical protein
MSTLKKIDTLTVPAVENSLALFDLPPTVVSYAKTFEKELLPLNTITREGPYHFRVFSDTNFIDLSRTYVQTITSIEKQDGNNWIPIADTPDDKNTGVKNNFGLSFIKQLKVNINNVEVYNSGVTYPYYAYMNTEFNTDYDLNSGFMQTSCYFSDRNNKNIDQNSYQNEGFKYRKERFAEAKKCKTYTKLIFDLANQNRLVLSNSDIVFSIWTSSDRFLIHAPVYNIQVPGIVPANQAGDEAARLAAQANFQIRAVPNGTIYRIKVHDVRMYCTMVDVVQSLNNSIARQLELTPAKYPMKKIEIRSMFLSEGMQNLTFNCFQTVLPRKVVVFFVDTNAFNGNPELSPFNFEHCNVRTISVESGGIFVPSTPYALDFSENNDDYLRAYHDFVRGLDMEKKHLKLTLEEYKNGWNGFCFDFRSYKRELGDAFELVKNGTTVLKINFAEPIGEGGKQLLVLGEFDQVLTMSAERVVSTDGSI